MKNKRRVKYVIIFLLLIVLSAALYIRRPKGVMNNNWGKGLITNYERDFYLKRIEQIFSNWQATKSSAEKDENGRLKDSYNTYLVIDIDKKAIWLEKDGQIDEENYAELSSGTNWTLSRYISTCSTMHMGRTRFKFRGTDSNKITPENFTLVGVGKDGYIRIYFDSEKNEMKQGLLENGMLSPIFPTTSEDATKQYGSLIVDEKEYQNNQSLIAESDNLSSDEETIQDETSLQIQKNKKAWNGIEKYFYIESEKEVCKAGYEIINISFEPGPDFFSGHAEVYAFDNDLLDNVLKRNLYAETYLKIDYLKDDIWYAKSANGTKIPSKSRKQQFMNLEFLISSGDKIPEDQYAELLKKGREIQMSNVIPESKWKVTLSQGVTVEFLGICENPSYGKKWWAPDGSTVNYVPYINTEPYSKVSEDRMIYEFAWRTTPKTGMSYSVEDCYGMYSYQILDRYGDQINESGLQAGGFGFSKSHQATALKLGFTFKEWKTVLQIEDKANEIKFLDKQRIVLEPPVIENGQIVIRCYDEFRNRMSQYKIDFGLIYYEGIESKTISLGRYINNVTDHQDTGLTEHKYVINDLNLSQIEGICFRYQPYTFVIFKNISLVPGQDQGFEIEVIEADE